jgi:hypothetical protein
MKLGINISVGQLYIKRGFEIKIKPFGELEPIDECLFYVNIFIDLFGRGDVRRLYEIVIGQIRPCISQYYIENRKSIFAYEFLQVLKCLYNEIPNKFKVVDFNDNEIAMVKTMQEAIEIFKEKYPYMDNNLIKNFIYET